MSVAAGPAASHAALARGIAELATRFGVEVRDGDEVVVGAAIGQEEVARAIALAAYEAGAAFVDVLYFDPLVRRARLVASRHPLDTVPGWMRRRITDFDPTRGCAITLASPWPAAAAAGVDPERAAQEPLPTIDEAFELALSGRLAWCDVPGPNLEWARQRHPDLRDDAALAALWSDIGRVLRLDDGDPVAAWRAQSAELERRAVALDALALDAIRFTGPGTDLTVGLLPSSRWAASRDTTPDERDFHPNVPSEEVYTTPDPARVEGRARVRRPHPARDGRLVADLELRFADGRLVSVEGGTGADSVRAQLAVDGGDRLGEVALVPGDVPGARLAPLLTTLIDENAGSHVALGQHLPWTVGDADRDRANASAIHVDVIVGAPDVDVDGVRADGSVVRLIAGGRWVGPR